MKLRRIASLTALLSFLLLAASSLVLYLAPQGRVAYWSDWRLLGLAKDQWGNLHINLGVLFLAAIGLHLFYNWSPILAYLRNRAREIRVFTPECNVALSITLAVAFGTYLELPPVRWVIDLNERVKASAAARFGEPPYGHAELSSLRSFVGRTGLPPEAVSGLSAAGLHFEDDRQSLLEIARANGVAPREVFEALRSALPGGAHPPMPTAPPPGTGRMTLGAICDTFGISVDAAVEALGAEGVAATPEMQLREIAEAAGSSPADIYGRLLGLAPARAPAG